MAVIRFKQIEKTIPGNIIISGSLSVYGNATFVQTSSDVPALIVSGSEVIVKSNIPVQTVSASLTIQNLGVWSDTGSNSTIDLGNESF
jgi:hypothetical protein